MSKELSSQNPDEVNLLIYKVGPLGGAPLDFMFELANQFDMEYLSSDEVRLDLISEREARGLSPEKARKVRIESIRSILAEESELALSESDVVLNMFHNEPESRRRTQEIAENAGANTVALNIHTPFKVARERVKEWTVEGKFTIPTDQWTIPPEKLARSMMSSLERPNKDEADYIFNIYGVGEVDDLLDRFEKRMIENDLIDPSD